MSFSVLKEQCLNSAFDSMHFPSSAYYCQGSAHKLTCSAAGSAATVAVQQVWKVLLDPSRAAHPPTPSRDCDDFDRRDALLTSLTLEGFLVPVSMARPHRPRTGRIRRTRSAHPRWASCRSRLTSRPCLILLSLPFQLFLTFVNSGKQLQDSMHQHNLIPHHKSL